MTERRGPARTIAESIATSGNHVADVEKAAGLSRGALRSYLNGSDIEAASLVLAGGLLGISPVALYPEETRA